jgi:hypothetical protein
MASPFRYFRKHTKAFLAVAAVLAIFIFVVGDAISRGSYGGGGDGGTQTVATWNGGKLNVAQLSSLMAQRRLTDDFLKAVFAQGGGSSYYDLPTSVPVLFLNPQQLDQLETAAIELEVMSDLAEQAGMSVSDNVINHYIQEIGLRKVSGQDVAQILANIGRGNQQANEAIVFNTLRKMLLQHFYRRSFGDASLVVLPEQRWEDWRKVNERISVEAAALPVEKFIPEVPEPNENQLLAFYNEYKDVEPGRFRNESGREVPVAEPGFAEPRRFRLQYLLGSVAGRAEQLMEKVTEEEIKQYYEDNKRTEFTKSSLPGEDAFNPPADDAAEAPATDNGTAAEQSPPASEDAQTPPADEAQPPAETPAAEPEAPAASGAEATEAPAEPQTPATEPTAPAETDSNENSSRAERRSPFQLVAFQETPEDGGDESSAGEQPSSSAADADAESADSSAASEASAPSEASVEATSAPAESAAPAEQGSTDDSSAPADPAAPATGGAVIDPAASLPADEDIEFEPLENVRDEIRRKLAEVKAEEELQRIMAEAAAQLQAEYNRYGTQVAAAIEKKQTPPEPPAKLADLKWLADQYGLTYEKTAPLTIRELFDTAVGKSVDAASERVTVTEAAYRSLQLFEPLLATELVGDWYLVMKTEDAPQRIPPFKEIRDRVVQAWKRAEAAKLAEKKAKELAAEVTKAGAPFDQFFFAERGYEAIKPTAFFSWRSYPVGQAGAGVPPSLSEVPELKNVGEDFMEAAFSLKGNEAAGLLNSDHSVAYVIRLDRKQYPDDELKQLFLREERGWLGQRDMLVEHYSVTNEAINKEIEERAGLEFNQEWLEERARQLQDRLN